MVIQLTAYEHAPLPNQRPRVKFVQVNGLRSITDLHDEAGFLIGSELDFCNGQSCAVNESAAAVWALIQQAKNTPPCR